MPPRLLTATTLALAALCAPGATGAAEGDPAPGAGRVEAGQILAESLAGNLREMAAEAGRRDLAGIARRFADGFAADGLPSIPGPLRREVKWISSHGWAREGVGGGAGEALVLRPVSEKELLERVGEVLAHFSSIEDITFELEEARFSDLEAAEGEAVVTLALVGRDAEGRREWLRGRFEIAARREEGEWRFTRWHTGALESLVATSELFSEVTGPAGIAHRFPRLGVAPNEGFLPTGGAVGDADGDGLMDLILTEPDGARLYVNDGKGGFRDVSESALPGDLPRPTAAAFLDHDQDGDSDIFLSSQGRQVLLESRVDPNGIRRFQDVSRRARVTAEAVGFSVAVTDVNGDGLPDLFVSSANLFGSVMPGSWIRAANGTPNLLFVNVGSGRFRESAADWGVGSGGWGQAGVFADVNADGWQDLYASNAFGGNALYLNKRTRLHDEARLRGVEGPAGSGGVAWGDYDNDGDLDLHVAGISSSAARRVLKRARQEPGPAAGRLAGMGEGNALFMNRGGAWFTDVTRKAGPFPAGWAFGGGFLDFDNDGWEDTFSVNGFVSGTGSGDASGRFWRHVAGSAAGREEAGGREFTAELMERIFSRGHSLAGRQRDALFLALGDGTYRDISGVSGVDSATDGRGALFADFDNDGDYDIVTTTSQGAARLLFRNNVGQDAGFVRITLEGTRSGKDAFGAVVRLKTSRGVQTKIKSGGSGFASVHDPRLLFGLGEDESAQWLEVTWPSGLKQRAGPIQVRDSLKIIEGSRATERVEEIRFSLPDPAGPDGEASGSRSP